MDRKLDPNFYLGTRKPGSSPIRENVPEVTVQAIF